jgi:hypothetical protein
VLGLFAPAVEVTGSPRCSSRFFLDVVTSFVWYYIINCWGLLIVAWLDNGGNIAIWVDL